MKKTTTTPKLIGENIGTNTVSVDMVGVFAKRSQFFYTYFEKG